MIDEDGDLITTLVDRHLRYSIFDGYSWTTPSLFAFNISTKDNLALDCLGNAVVLGYTYQTPDPNYVYEEPDDNEAVGYDYMQNPFIVKAFYRYYDTNEDTWGDEMLFSSGSAYEFENISESAIAFATRDSRFVATWEHNSTLMYKLLHPEEPR